MEIVVVLFVVFLATLYMSPSFALFVIDLCLKIANKVKEGR
jgi:hypothetical protein